VVCCNASNSEGVLRYEGMVGGLSLNRLWASAQVLLRGSNLACIVCTILAWNAGCSEYCL
jgi:hypothetical protein